jgi:predicted nucleic acid-binding protein
VEDVDRKAGRLLTLDRVAGLEVLGVDAQVAAEWGRLRAHLRGSRHRVNVNDLWIAATALAHRLPVVTQDADFDALEGLGGLVVVRV